MKNYYRPMRVFRKPFEIRNSMLRRLTLSQQLYFWAILASIGLSLWLNTNHLINEDGILYLKTAQVFLEEGFRAAQATYNWPFYSILIAGLHQLLPLSWEHTALLLNTFLCVLVVIGFIAITKILGGNHRVQVFAAIIILLHTGFNDYRDYIIRDLGHWAFLLYALYFFIRYAQNAKLHFALAFGGTIFIAFLFRTEAIFVLLLAPFVLLLPTAALSIWQRFARFLGAYIIAVPLLLLIIAGSILEYEFLLKLLRSNTWLKTIPFIPIHFISNFYIKFEQFRTMIPEFVPNNYLIYMMGGGLISYFLVRCLVLLSPVYTFLGGYAWYKHSVAPSLARRIIMTFILIYLLIALGFLFYRFFLTGRYMMPLVLLLSLWAPFGLNAIYETWQNRKTWLFPIMVAGLVYLLGDTLISTAPTQLYLKEAGLWLNTHVPKNFLVCSNNKLVAYYNQSDVVIENKMLKYYTAYCDYIAIAIQKNDQQTNSELEESFYSIQVFANERGERVEILKNAQSRNRTGTGD